VSSLDAFIADRWFEDLSFVVKRGLANGPLYLGPLAPPAAHDKKQWIEQKVEVKALAEDRLVAAGTPVAVDAPTLGTVFSFAGGVVRAQGVISLGTRYWIWSYVPDPSPAALAAAPARYSSAARPFLTLWGRTMPGYGAVDRDRRVEALLRDPSYSDLGAYRTLYEDARRVTRGSKSPYAAVLALESWFRQRGGFRYTEHPPPTRGRPLIDFVEKTRAGYCQHFAGAMALMARLLGIPARVAVGFTSGHYEGGGWTVTDHDAHAWVEAWFPGYGWIPFDPTPGRGTFSTQYSVASNSRATVAALRHGALDKVVADRSPGDLDGLGGAASGSRNDPPSILLVGVALALLCAVLIGVAKWIRRRLGYLTVDPRRSAAATRKELESFLRDQGVAVPRSATLEDLRAAVADELALDASAYVAAAGRARFGDPQDAPSAARAARAELRELLHDLREHLSLGARLRGFVSLRSLRGWQG
jgi:transglutaminase-like putative cysteine protease